MHEEEVKLGELFHSVISDPSEVVEKINKVKMEIIESSPIFNAIKDALLETRTSADLLKGHKLRLKQLQTQHFVLHKRCDLLFSSQDTNFVGYTARELKGAGCTAKELKDAGCTPNELKGLGFAFHDMYAASYEGFKGHSQSEFFLVDCNALLYFDDYIYTFRMYS
jgi:hypothetical protein